MMYVAIFFGAFFLLWCVVSARFFQLTFGRGQVFEFNYAGKVLLFPTMVFLSVVFWFDHLKTKIKSKKKG